MVKMTLRKDESGHLWHRGNTAAHPQSDGLISDREMIRTRPRTGI
jgi:hypothetical protein